MAQRELTRTPPPRPQPALGAADGLTAQQPKLRRVLTLWPLTFYGTGVIVGAGIYVALGSIMAKAGEAAALSFLLAGAVAALTGLCYAELACRYPEASGAAAYVGHGFGSTAFTMLVGAATTAAVAIAAASIAGGAVQYLAELIPLARPILVTLFVAACTLIAALGVSGSVGLAAAIGGLEILGLIGAGVAGLVIAPDYDLSGLVPKDLAAWRGVTEGAFIAFFAFIGFETLANMAEEAKTPEVTVPRAMVGAIGASLLLYVFVAVSVVLADRGGQNPLLALFEHRWKLGFAVIGFMSVGNGVLIEVIMLARLFYGLASKGRLPGLLAAVHPATGTPVIATVAAGAIVLGTALLLPFERLLVLTNLLTLSIFLFVDLALARLKWLDPETPVSFRTPVWLPMLAAGLTMLLLVFALVSA